ncbi:MAG: hypothetical protein RLZ98_3313 [Pseudomonadota bacterium]|jgi:CBS domain containing-hemolysin-like protein
MTIALTLLVMLLLLLLKGFFSGSEIGLVSADRVKLRSQAANGHKGARLAERLLKDPARLLTTTLLGTNFATVALATVGTLMMVDLFKEQGEIIAVLVFTPLFLILGEIVPKSIYQQKANAIVPVVAWPLAILQVVLAPLIWFFSAFARLAAWAIGGGPDGRAAARDLFYSAVRAAEDSATAAAFSKGQVRNVLRLAQQTAEEAMRPLTTLRAFPADAKLDDIVAHRLQGGLRLIPLYEGEAGNIIAVATLESWDLLDPDLADRTVGDFVGLMERVPASKPVSEIIETLHAAPDLTLLVTGDDGAALGLITLQLLVRRTLGVEPTLAVAG